jgi:hypothetical protein
MDRLSYTPLLSLFTLFLEVLWTSDGVVLFLSFLSFSFLSFCLACSILGLHTKGVFLFWNHREGTLTGWKGVGWSVERIAMNTMSGNEHK